MENKEIDKAIEEEAENHRRAKQYNSESYNAQMVQSFKKGAHFGFTLGKASMQGEIDWIKNERDCYHKQLMQDEDKIIKLRDQLTQRDATIKSLNEMVEVMEHSFKWYASYGSENAIPLSKQSEYGVCKMYENARFALTRVSALRKKEV